MKDDKRKSQEENLTKLRKVSRKRWFYPAVYLCVAALVMSGVLWMENGHSGANKNNNAQIKTPSVSNHNVASNPQKNVQDAIPTNSTNSEVLKWPVTDPSQVTIGQKFYNADGSQADQVAALVNYDNTYAPNTGINLVAKDKKSFDVTAAMSGTVTRAKQDPILGYVVQIQHDNGVSTLYESLAAIDVQSGDHVQQGQLIGQAGTDKYNKALGTHLHFEVRKNNVPVDPTAYWNKKTATVTAQPASSKSSDQSKSGDQSGSSNSNQDSSSSNQDSSNSNNMNSTSPMDSSNSGK